jgi:alkylated DNA repair protein (DNA oxidative demethylase)
MTDEQEEASRHTGFRHVPGYLDRDRQEKLLAAVREAMRRAPLYTPRMPKSGQAMSVRMTNCGPLGWMTDKDGGYRYQATHPETGAPWPPIPDPLLAAWRELADYPHPPEACLVNFYGPTARMGLHQDRDEEDLAAPVLSLSLGDSCLFRVGGAKRNDPTRTLRLASGDALVLGGSARLAFHGVDRILPATSTLLPEGGRINLTLRRVTRPAPGKTSAA